MVRSHTHDGLTTTILCGPMGQVQCACSPASVLTPVRASRQSQLLNISLKHSSPSTITITRTCQS